ncbi:hypothetical protein ACOSP7_010321 [Xanthoceras sorbifolium]
MMASKSNNINKSMIIHTLLALLFVSYVISSSRQDGLHKFLEEENANETHFKDNFVKLCGGVVTTSARDGFITLSIKFLHFFVAKSLQLRSLSALQSSASSSISSWLFWVAFTLFGCIHVG